MNRLIRLYCCCALAGLGLTGAVQAADAIDDVEKKLIAAAEKHKTMTAKMVSLTEMEGPQIKMKMKTEGTTETARRGEKVLSRNEMKSTGTTKFGDQPEQKMDEKSLAICDGEFCYVLNEGTNGKQAMKMKLDTAQQGAVTKGWFEHLRKDYDIKILPEEKIEGKATYVIEATLKKPAPGQTQKSTFWYDKESAVVLKAVTEGKQADNKTKMTMTMSDVKLDVDIKPERFQFKAPDGVQVMDMTKMGQEAQASGGEETGETKAEPAPAEEKKTEPAKKEEKPKEEKKPLIPKLKLR